MAKLGNVNVAAEYDKLVLPNLYLDSTMQPGITFNDHSLEKAGSRYVPKAGAGKPIDPSNTVGDITHNAVQDELVGIVVNNFFRDGRKIYNMQIESVSYEITEANMREIIHGVIRPSFNRSALACLVQEGTNLADTQALTKETIGDYLLELRKQLRDKGAEGNVLIVSTDIYKMIQQAAKTEFDRDVKNAIVASGKVGYWNSWFIIESNIFTGANAAKYYDHTGTLKIVDLTKVEMIAYDWHYFFIDNLPSYMDKEKIPGQNYVAVGVEIGVGYTVANKDCVLIKKKA